MSISVSNEADRRVIRVKGRLDFNIRQQFREAYETGDSPQNYIIDFSESNYIDSSALGMMLLMRDYVAQKVKVPIQIIHCGDEIRNILQVSNFGRFFTIT